MPKSIPKQTEAPILPKPFLKWAGGKRALLPLINEKIPEQIQGNYIEPFLGAGAVFFSRNKEEQKIVNDSNLDLIQVYQVIRDDLDQLIIELKKHRNNKDYFLTIRRWDRNPSRWEKKTSVQRAARFIYLNKTCFNGLYRVNSKGNFNVPFGHYAKPDFKSDGNLRAVSEFLNTKSAGSKRAVKLKSGNYREVTAMATENDFVYLDPPYDPVSATASFVSYQRGGFTSEDQKDLKDEILRLTELGVRVLLSNSDTQYIRSLYSDKKIFKTKKIEVARTISAKASSRIKTGEVLIDNYKTLG